MIDTMFFVIGMVFGSFLNVIIYRLPRGESIVLPPSHCPNCQHRLAWWDLFPILSYIFLGGRCGYCHSKISWQYPLMEVFTGVLTWLWWLRIGSKQLSGESCFILILIYVLFIIAVIDFEQQIIPNWLTYPMIIAGIIIQGLTGHLSEALLGLVIGAGILFLIAVLYPRGMGWGDVKLLAMTGVFLGWQKVIVSLFLGSFLGVIVIVPIFLIKKKNRKIPFAFGPFLVEATLIIIYFWNWLQNWIPIGRIFVFGN